MIRMVATRSGHGRFGAIGHRQGRRSPGPVSSETMVDRAFACMLQLLNLILKSLPP
jgi:hypothetical protein